MTNQLVLFSRNLLLLGVPALMSALSISENARAESYVPPDLTAEPTRVDRFEITGSGGYQFGGSVETEDASASFDSGPAVGGMLGVRVRGNALAVAGYHYQFSRVNLTARDEMHDGMSFDMAVGYVQIGGEIEFPVRPKIKPLLGMTLGAVHFTPDRDGAETDWFFAGSLFGGLKIPLLRHFGLRADFKLLVTVLDNDSTALCVSGKGCVTELEVNAMAQGEIAGGAYLAF